MSSTARKRLATGDLSVQIRPEGSESPVKEVPQAGLDLVNRQLSSNAFSERSTPRPAHAVSELALTRGWIGFDEENVVVLKEQSHGRQALVVYDFT